jgi:UDP-3-O-[3-hydroxymyristoyl] N-acetylglucosamine deacetylase
MHTYRQQQTIAQPVSVTGVGYWSGRDVRVELRPASANTGVVFVRRDLELPVHIAARIENRIETPRRTTLTSDGTSVEMVEHIMAALAGLQIDNCEVWVDSAEMPGCDGSSLAFVEALDSAGVVVQDAPRTCLVIGEVTRLGNEEGWIEARPASRQEFSVKFRLDYAATAPAIGRQTLEMAITPQSFRDELASSRTFLLEQEAQWLLDQGLGTRVTKKDLLIFDEEGPIENELRHEDECVRHKMLDLVGDLALMGCDVIGHVVAHRSGHRLNAELAKALIQENEVIHQWKASA